MAKLRREAGPALTRTFVNEARPQSFSAALRGGARCRVSSSQRGFRAADAPGRRPRRLRRCRARPERPLPYPAYGTPRARRRRSGAETGRSDKRSRCSRPSTSRSRNRRPLLRNARNIERFKRGTKPRRARCIPTLAATRAFNEQYGGVGANLDERRCSRPLHRSANFNGTVYHHRTRSISLQQFIFDGGRVIAGIRTREGKRSRWARDADPAVADARVRRSASVLRACFKPTRR